MSRLTEREARFHDDWAGREDPATISVEAAFEAPTALENRFVLERLGDLRGVRVLEVGAGLGEPSVMFALRGAQVTATDVAPEMLRFAAELARRRGVELRTLVTSGEELALPDASFDVVFLANTIHHVQERDRLFGELHRVLVPGGRFFAWDPLKYNPVIAVYRRLASGVRTEDERPLGVADLALARRFFPDTEARFFWLATQALFLKYFLVDRVNPSGARYWRRILKEDAASLGWWMPLEKLDRLLTAVPGLRWLAWNVVLFGSKQR